jgi:hypothetical protein
VVKRTLSCCIVMSRASRSIPPGELFIAETGEWGFLKSAHGLGPCVLLSLPGKKTSNDLLSLISLSLIRLISKFFWGILGCNGSALAAAGA